MREIIVFDLSAANSLLFMDIPAGAFYWGFLHQNNRSEARADALGYFQDGVAREERRLLAGAGRHAQSFSGRKRRIRYHRQIVKIN